MILERMKRRCNHVPSYSTDVEEFYDYEASMPIPPNLQILFNMRPRQNPPPPPPPGAPGARNTKPPGPPGSHATPPSPPAGALGMDSITAEDLGGDGPKGGENSYSGLSAPSAPQGGPTRESADGLVLPSGSTRESAGSLSADIDIYDPALPSAATLGADLEPQESEFATAPGWKGGPPPPPAGTNAGSLHEHIVPANMSRTPFGCENYENIYGFQRTSRYESKYLAN